MFNKNPLIILIISISLVNVLCGTKAKYLTSQPYLTETSRKFTTFSIDFRAIDTPAHTYWCLLQWKMDLTKFKENHQNVSGGVAYGGLQSTDTEPHGIMSFWQVEYKENNQSKAIKSTRIYPKGQESTFSNEGVGTIISVHINGQQMFGIDILFIVGKIIQLEILLFVNGIKICKQRNGHYLPILILD